MQVRFLEHPTDLRMQAWGKDQGELFLQSALGMLSKLAPLRRPGDYQSRQTKPIELSAPAVEELFVAWLNEILYQFYSKEFYFVGAKFTVLSAEKISGTIEGWPISQVKLHKGLEVKGVTYHGLRITRDPRWDVEVILDV